MSQVKNFLLLVDHLKQKGLHTRLVSGTNHDIDIAELQGDTFVINLESRNILEIIFTIGHLYGHLLQPIEKKKKNSLLMALEAPKPLAFSPAMKEALYAYEFEAHQIGLEMMQNAFEVTESFKEKYKIFIETDFDYICDYMITGRKLNATEFNRKLRQNYKSMKGKLGSNFETIKGDLTQITNINERCIVVD